MFWGPRGSKIRVLGYCTVPLEFCNGKVKIGSKLPGRNPGQIKESEKKEGPHLFSYTRKVEEGHCGFFRPFSFGVPCSENSVWSGVFNLRVQTNFLK